MTCKPLIISMHGHHNHTLPELHTQRTSSKAPLLGTNGRKQAHKSLTAPHGFSRRMVRYAYWSSRTLTRGATYKGRDAIQCILEVKPFKIAVGHCSCSNAYCLFLCVLVTGILLTRHCRYNQYHSKPQLHASSIVAVWVRLSVGLKYSRKPSDAQQF